MRSQETPTVLNTTASPTPTWMVCSLRSQRPDVQRRLRGYVENERCREARHSKCASESSREAFWLICPGSKVWTIWSLALRSLVLQQARFLRGFQTKHSKWLSLLVEMRSLEKQQQPTKGHFE